MQISSLEWFAHYEIMICYLDALSIHKYIAKVITTCPPWVQPLLQNLLLYHLKQRVIICLTAMQALQHWFFQNSFPLFGQVTSGYTTFVLFFGQHLPCWSRESTLVTVPHSPTPTCSKYFYPPPCNLLLQESWATIIHKGWASTVQNSGLTWRKSLSWPAGANSKVPQYYFPPNMRASSIKASLKTWPSYHSVI